MSSYEGAHSARDTFPVATVRYESPDVKQVSFSLTPTPPFRLDLTVWALRRRPENAVDVWDGRVYRRVLVLKSQPFLVQVTQTGTAVAPQLRVTIAGAMLDRSLKPAVGQALARLLGTGVDLSEFYRLAALDKKLSPLVEQFRGMKPPRFPTVFEAIINGVACQQLSLAAGIQMLNRLAERFGRAVECSDTRAHAFPRPEDLSGIEPESIARLGFNRQKARAMVELSRALVERCLDLEALDSLTDAEAINYLDQLRGVGRWTAEYALLRGAGRLYVFPGDDVGARNGLQRWLHLRGPLDYKGVHRVLARWEPYAGLVYFHMLLNSLDRAGLLT
jgi:DNA-3-methyladenine glycosylase II